MSWQILSQNPQFVNSGYGQVITNEAEWNAAAPALQRTLMQVYGGGVQPSAPVLNQAPVVAPEPVPTPAPAVAPVPAPATTSVWQQLSQNPTFKASAIGGYMTEDIWNKTDKATQDQILNVFKVPQDGGGPVLSQDAAPVVAPAPIVPEAPADPNAGFVQVPINQGTNMPVYVVDYNPTTGAVRAREGDTIGQMAVGANEANVQNMARDAYNAQNQQPVLKAQDQMNTAQGILNATPEGDPSGAALDMFTNAQSNLQQAQQTADANVSDPTAVDMVGSRVLGQVKTPTQTGLEQMEGNPALMQRQTAPVAPVGGGPVDFNAMEAQYGTSPVLVNATKPADTAKPTAATNTTTTTTTTAKEPVLKSGGQGRSTGALSAGSITSSSGPKTSNARGSGINQLLVDRNEALIRIGGAMYTGALQGNGLGAASQEYGKIQDYNRAATSKELEAQRKQALEMAKLRAKGSGGGLGKKAAGQLAGLSDTMMNYKSALQAIRDSRAAGGNLTGIGGWIKGYVDNFTGDEDAARRLVLQRVKVDDALLRVAETKGAISNAEMKLFLAPAPSNLQDEAIWEQWLLDRMEALERVQARLSQGASVPAGQRPTGATASGLSQEDLNYMNQ